MSNNFQEVRDLLKEREDIEKKLLKLEELKSQTKPHIYEKVKNDYEGKLKKIVSSLNGHVEALEKSLKELTPKLQDIVKDETEIDDAIAELTLRYQLGDYNENEYNSKKEEYEKQLESIRGKKNEIEKEIGEINFLLNAITGAESNEPAHIEESNVIEESLMEENVFDESNQIEEIGNISETDNLEESFDNLIEETTTEDIGDTSVSDTDILSSDKILEEIESSDTQPDAELIGGEDFLEDLASELSSSEKSVEDSGSLENLEELEGMENLDDIGNMDNIENMENLEDIGDLEESLDSLVEDISEELGLEDIGEGSSSDSDIIHEDETLQLDSDVGAEGIKCPKCGFINKPDAWFCEKCSAELQ